MKFKKNDAVTIAAIVSEALPLRGLITHAVKLISFEHEEPLLQPAPLSRRGGPAPKSEEPKHSRMLEVGPTDTVPSTMHLKPGMEVRVLAHVAEVEGFGEQAHLTVVANGRRLTGPAAEALLAPPLTKP